MRMSKLNTAILMQFAGLLMLGMPRNNIVRIIGVVAIISGGILYRREQKRLKTVATISKVEVDEGKSNGS